MSTPTPAPVREAAVVPGRGTAATTATTARGRLLGYARREFVRNVRMIENTFFIVVLPVALFLMFGALADWGDQRAGHGNVSAYTMTGIAVYGAVMATTSIAGSAAVERQSGWGRQLSLTALTPGAYLAGKCLVALTMAALPVLAVLVTGWLTGAELDGPMRWPATGAPALVSSLPFALFGMAAALLFRSEAAVSAASGTLVVFGFLGNLFVPLSGIMLDIGRFTPVYGAGVLARWPQMEGEMASMGPESAGADPLWLPIVNLLAWTAVFAVICLLASRSRTARA